MRIGKSLLAAAVAGLSLLGAATAQANTLEVLWGGTDGAGNFTYNLHLSPTGKLTSGNYFVIYYFAGYDGIVSQPADFKLVGTPATGNGGMTPPVGLPYGFMDTNLPNVVLEYTGTTPLYGEQDLTPLVLHSKYIGVNEAGATTSADSGGTMGQFYSQYIPVAAVPLPAAAWAGMSLLGLLGGAKVVKSRRNA